MSPAASLDPPPAPSATLASPAPEVVVEAPDAQAGAASASASAASARAHRRRRSIVCNGDTVELRPPRMEAEYQAIRADDSPLAATGRSLRACAGLGWTRCERHHASVQLGLSFRVED